MDVQPEVSYVGFRFRPTAELILGFYLKNLYTSGPKSVVLGSHGFIREIDIYGEVPPWEIGMQYFPESQRRNFYAVTKLKTASANRIARTTTGNGRGTWKGQSGRKKIQAVWGGDVFFGEKKTLSFQVQGVSSHWNMTEYSLFEINGRKLTPAKEFENYVLCHVTLSNRSNDDVAVVAAAPAGNIIIADHHQEEERTRSKRPRMSPQNHRGFRTLPQPYSQSCQLGAYMELGSSSTAASLGGDQVGHWQQLSNLAYQSGACVESVPSSSAAGCGGGQYHHHQQSHSGARVIIVEQENSSSAPVQGHGDHQDHDQHISSVPPEAHDYTWPLAMHDQSQTDPIPDNDVYIGLDMFDEELSNEDQQQLPFASPRNNSAPAATEGMTFQQLDQCENQEDTEDEFQEVLDLLELP